MAKKKKKAMTLFEVWSWTALAVLVLIVLIESTFSLTNAWELSNLTTNLKKYSTGASVLLEEKARMAQEAVMEKEEMKKEMNGDGALAAAPDGTFVLRGTEQCAARSFGMISEGDDSFTVSMADADGEGKQDIGTVLVQTATDFTRKPMAEPWELYFRNDRIAVGAQWGAPVYDALGEQDCELWVAEK